MQQNDQNPEEGKEKGNKLPPLPGAENLKKDEGLPKEGEDGEKESKLPPLPAQQEKRTPNEAADLGSKEEKDLGLPKENRSVTPEETKMELHKKGLDASILEYKPGNSLDDMLQGAKVLIESGILPNLYSEPEQVVGALKMGHEYGFSSIIALNNIHMIEGKPTLSVHMIGALLMRGGWRFNIEQEPMPENNFTVYIRFTNTEQLDALNKELIDASKLPAEVLSSVVQNLEIKRKSITQLFSFSWAEADAMKLTSKSNWQKMPKIMLRNRCITLGARAVAPDLLMGMMETSEWADVENITLDLDEEGNVKGAA